MSTNSLPRDVYVLRTRIPEAFPVQGLDYGAHATLPEGSGYFVRPSDSDLPLAFARQDPTIEDSDADIVAAVAEEITAALLPVIVVEAGERYLEPVAELRPALTIESAKQEATAAGYAVIDERQGGNCETTDAWDHRRVVHVVTVLPAAPTTAADQLDKAAAAAGVDPAPLHWVASRIAADFGLPYEDVLHVAAKALEGRS